MKQLNGGHIKKRQPEQLQRTANSSRAGQGRGQGGGKGSNREGEREMYRGSLSLQLRMAAHLAHYKMPQRKNQSGQSQFTWKGVGGGVVEPSGEPCKGLAMSESSLEAQRKGGVVCTAIKWRARCLIKSQRINRVNFRAQLTSTLSLSLSLSALHLPSFTHYVLVSFAVL